ncbi:MAG: carbohydrate ABC transporter permease [Bauldia sp.]|nr:carbohydrate ABC transporter permease [Bauldia sp.]
MSTTTTLAPNADIAVPKAADVPEPSRRVRRFKVGRLVTHIALLLIVAIWTLPTFGLLISSVRDPDQLALSGWWTALSTSTISAQSERLPAAGTAVVEDGLYTIRGNLLGADDNRTIRTFGGTATTAGANPVGATIELRAGGTITVEENGDYVWTSPTPFEYTTAPRISYVASMAPRFTLENYSTVLNANGIGRSFINSATVAIPATIISVMVAAFAAYALAWMKFPGRTFFVIAVVALLVVPLQMALVPVLRLHVQIAGMFGIDGKGYFAVWLAHTGFGLPLAVYLLRNYMVGLPREIMESARMDGASHFQTFTTMVLPLSVPALASIAIFQFLWIWNDLLVALVFLGSQDEYVVLTGKLVDLLGTMGSEWHILTAGAFISILVPLIVFFSLQRYFVRGLLAGSVK